MAPLPHCITGFGSLQLLDLRHNPELHIDNGGEVILPPAWGRRSSAFNQNVHRQMLQLSAARSIRSIGCKGPRQFHGRMQCL